MKLRWTQRSNFGPRPRAASSIAHDAARGRTVLFGGAAPAANLVALPLGDTWEWDGSYWTQTQDIGPRARSLAAMAYDSARNLCVLFGGLDDASLASFGDTWHWDGGNWTKIAETGPGARHGHAVAFDAGRGRLVLFGGQTAPLGGTILADTWEFDGETWTQQEDSGPAGRFGHGMAFDGKGRVVMFGGFDSQALLHDTWAWNGEEWVQIAEFGPSARQAAAMAAGDAGEIVLFGGKTSAALLAPPIGDTWAFDGKLWTQRQDIGPGPLQFASLAYDRGRSTFVLFGGMAGGDIASAAGNTWEARSAAVPLAGQT